MLLIVLLQTWNATATAQLNRTDDAAPTVYRIEALAGKPFGVGMMRYRMCAGDEMIDQSGATLLSEKNNRVF